MHINTYWYYCHYFQVINHNLRRLTCIISIIYMYQVFRIAVKTKFASGLWIPWVPQQLEHLMKSRPPQQGM